MIHRNVPNETGSKVHRTEAEAEAWQGCRALEYTPPHITIHTACSTLLSKSENKSGKYQFMQKQTLWPGGALHSNSLQHLFARLAKRTTTTMFMLSFYEYYLILPREHHKYTLTIIQTPTSE